MKRFARAILIALLVVGLAGAGAVLLTKRSIDLADYPEGAIAAMPRAATTDIGLKFSILPTAATSAPEGIMFEGGSWLKSRPMNHSAVMICHPKAFILFDTGLGRHIASQFGEFPAVTRLFFGYNKLTAVADVIAQTNPCPGRPVIIIPSHLHWDHAGGIEDLPEAEVWVKPAEKQQAESGGVDQGFLPGEIDARTIKWRALSFSDHPYEQYRQSRDIFGDGSLVLVPMEGHTAGSVGLFITTVGRRYFLTGDTSWAIEGFTRPAHKFFSMRGMVDVDLPRLDAELVGVHRLMKRDPGLIVIPAHDATAYPADAVYPNWLGAPK